MVERITEEAINCPAVSPTSGSNMITAVISPDSLPYLLRKYSGTVFTVAARNFGATNDRITKASPIVIMYHAALKPYPDIPFCTTPRELPPPISVAARVPAISSGPSRLPATIKSVLLLILVDEYHPIKSMAIK